MCIRDRRATERNPVVVHVVYEDNEMEKLRDDLIARGLPQKEICATVALAYAQRMLKLDLAVNIH